MAFSSLHMGHGESCQNLTISKDPDIVEKLSSKAERSVSDDQHVVCEFIEIRVMKPREDWLR